MPAQAFDGKLTENASPWAAALSRRGALRGARLAAERAYGEHACVYVASLRTGMRRKKRERRRLDRCVALPALLHMIYLRQGLLHATSTISRHEPSPCTSLEALPLRAVLVKATQQAVSLLCGHKQLASGRTPAITAATCCAAPPITTASLE